MNLERERYSYYHDFSRTWSSEDLYKAVSLFPLPSSPLDQRPHRLPRTSVGVFHVAYIEKISEAKWWRCRSDSGCDDCMSQIKGDITGRTSKERYEQLILELCSRVRIAFCFLRYPLTDKFAGKFVDLWLWDQALGLLFSFDVALTCKEVQEKLFPPKMFVNCSF